MLGVATLIVVMSVMNGFRAELLKRILGMNGHIGVFQTYATQPPDTDIKSMIESVAGVKGAYPLVKGRRC